MKQYINWKLSNGTKIPVGPTGVTINHLDPVNWMERDEALKHGPVAVVLTKDDPYFVVDIDKCLVNGQWDERSQSVFNALPGAACEVSQSGTGLHFMGRCDKSQTGVLRNRTAEIEFYTHDRFICEGGRGWQGNPDLDWTDTLLKIIPHREKPVEGVAHDGTGPREGWSGPSDDDELIARMTAARGGMSAQFGEKATAGELWQGDPLVMARFFPDAGGRTFDASAADAALIAHLAFWTGCDAERMNRLFARSGLMRDKWKDRPDYRLMTITGATQRCQNVYNDGTGNAVMPGTTADTARIRGSVLDLNGVKELFEGCTYIADAHKILVPDGTMMSPERFKAWYGGYEFAMDMGSGRPTKSAFEAFTENRGVSFPKARTTRLMPDKPFGEIVDGAVNVFKRHEPVISHDAAEPFVDLMTKLFPVEHDRDIMLSWMAACVQHQGHKFLWAPAVQGTKGNGKGTIAEIIRYCIGQQWSFPVDPEKLSGQFNDFIENKLFLSVDEIHMGGRQTFLDAIKPLITDSYISIEGKGVSQKTIHNCANWYFTTNHKSAIIKERDDRRFAVFFTPQQSRGDMIRDGMGGEFFTNLWSWLREQGGFAATAGFLFSYQIPAELNPALSAGGLCKWAPETSSTEEAIGASVGPLESEIRDAIEEDRQGFRGGWVSSHALARLVNETNIRISRPRRNEIITSMGYRSIGRCGQRVMEEDGKRPVMYVNDDVKIETTEAFLMAQGYATGAPSMVHVLPQQKKTAL